MTTIKADTDSYTGVLFAVLGGIFRLRITDGTEPGHRSAHVLDDEGELIGSAHDLIYGARGWAVSTHAYGGFVSAAQVELVP